MTDYTHIIYTDGGGKSSVVGGKACAIITYDGKTPSQILYREYAKEITCNEAEYFAVILALEDRIYGEKILIKSDSNLVVNQLNREKPWKINFEHLKILNDAVLDMIDSFNLDVAFEYVPRDNNLAGLFIEGRLSHKDEIVRKERIE
jgi:ribonuclease HI